VRAYIQPRMVQRGHRREVSMADTVMLLLATASFVFFLGYVAVCDRL
jgi:hypothetical protein